MTRYKWQGVRHLFGLSKLPFLRAAMRLQGVQARRPSIVGVLPLFRNGRRARFGLEVRFSSIVHRCSFLVARGATLQVGDRTFFNDGCQIVCKESVSIGSDCMFAELSCVMDSDQHPISENEQARHGAVVIGNNVWLGRNATVLAGVELGDHCVVAAGSVVTRSFPNRTIIAGVPGRAIGSVTCSDDFKRP